MRNAQPPDLDMRVRTVGENRGTRLIYTLHSPTGAVAFAHREIAGPVLRGSPEEYQGHLLHKIEQLGARMDIDGSALLRAEIDRKLASLGRDLWRELFPSELRFAYRDIRSRVRTWMIVSDEPWIPWELIKPYDDSRPDDIIDDDFLAFGFELTRWMAGDRAPAQRIMVRSLAVLLTSADLPHAAAERGLLAELTRSHSGLTDTTPILTSSGDLLTFLETAPADLLHVIGHGVHASPQSEEAGLPFRDGSVLRPVDLEGPLATRLSRARPLVFLNACWAGRQGWSLARLGGWAARWVDVCGCGAFVAPLWPVRDEAALAFSQAFYSALARGKTLGQAACEARRHTHNERPGDPSALAYVVYAHPNARIGWGENPAVEEAASSLPVSRELELRALPKLSVRRRRWAPRSIALGLLLLGAAATGWLSLFHSPTHVVADLPAPTPEPTATPVKPRSTPHATAPAKPSSGASLTMGGNRFDILTGSGISKASLGDALRHAAKPLASSGITGWAVHLEVDAPQHSSYSEEGAMLETCRLAVRCSAQKSGVSRDLGAVTATRSQPSREVACDMAVQALAEAVVAKLISSLKEGDR